MIADKTLFRNIVFLVSGMLAMLFLPYWGGYFFVHGQFPDGYFQSPPVVPGPKAPFNALIFGICLAIFATVILLYSFPTLFGFKKAPTNNLHILDDIKSKVKVRFPAWFWIGLFLWGGTLFVLWGHFTKPVPVIHWAALFLYWGFTFMLDGMVYKRTGGISIISTRPRELIGIGVASISGWLLFEFLNFFVDDNWCYPMGIYIPQSEFVIYAVVGSSGLMPMALEWYSLFNTFKFRHKYSYGPKIAFPQWLKITLLILSLVVMFVIPFYPSAMFAALWLTPMILMGTILSIIKIWTPFTPVKDGNWSPLAFSALAYGVQGFLCEFWNYFSGTHYPDGSVFSNNPDYWTYSLPYVDKFHVFEMPLVGMMGYLPFGVYCAVWWIAFAYLLNLPTKFFDDGARHLDKSQP